MKYISFAIPCYNSESYMSHAIESILPGGDDVEIIIVNDGNFQMFNAWFPEAKQALADIADFAHSLDRD